MIKSCIRTDQCFCTEFNRHLCKEYQEAKKKRKTLRRFSPQRAADEKKYSAEAKVYLEANPLCVAKLPGCGGRSQQVHHKAKRGRNLLKVETWMPVCYKCHNWIENNKKEARQKGFLK